MDMYLNVDMNLARCICVLGGDTALGRQVISVARRCGFHVKTQVRDPSFEHSANSTEVVQCELDDQRCLTDVVSDCMAVINCYGPTMRPCAGGVGTEAAKLTRSLLPKLHRKGARRYIVVSHSGVVLPGDRPRPLGTFATRVAGALGLCSRLADKQNEAAMLMQCDLDWTLVRCGKLKARRTVGACIADRHSLRGGFVSTETLARFLVHQIDCTSYLRSGVFVNSRNSNSHVSEYLRHHG
ncbi:hypothetical protein RMSM_06479 [Rhodopirellula maiorica SM1]|uniref:NAD(P)-binding domain-containing protein n=1 Tax=Rhodopirellula maiorica SM1 TaxID=1265738 RepID=M5RMH9_9BACT|nr:NAD(P)-binding oxidoreductase [Rhodopirellula maiorica]EMI16597.1 hypothetical protein RMSM_06479 [Rhodopirellula maiorica SM1]